MESWSYFKIFTQSSCSIWQTHKNTCALLEKALVVTFCPMTFNLHIYTETVKQMSWCFMESFGKFSFKCLIVAKCLVIVLSPKTHNGTWLVHIDELLWQNSKSSKFYLMLNVMKIENWNFKHIIHVIVWAVSTFNTSTEED